MNDCFKKRRARIGALTFGLAGLFVLAAIRLAMVVLVDGPRLSSLARSEHTTATELTAVRGPIVDRNGKPFALSAETRSVYARPRRLRENSTVADRANVAAALRMAPAELEAELHRPAPFVWLKRHVAPGGSALVQAIVIADELFDGYRRHPDFIQTYVFPGGMLLSPASLREQCRQAGLKIAELYSFGLDYARTLEAWLGRFDTVADQVAKLGFDERFRRMWRYYLAYCAAGFSTRRTDVLQAHFRHI